MTSDFELAARFAREIREREALMLECLDAALSEGHSIRDLAEITGLARSTLQRKLASPFLHWVKVSDPELAREVDAVRLARVERLREQVAAAAGRVEALPAMEAEIAEENRIAIGLVDVRVASQSTNECSQEPSWGHAGCNPSVRPA